MTPQGNRITNLEPLINNVNFCLIDLSSEVVRDIKYAFPFVCGKEVESGLDEH